MAWYFVLPIFVLLLTVPFFLGAWLGRRLRMPDHGWKIGLILFSLASAAVVVATGWPPKAGIDLSGGVVLVYEVQPPVQGEGELGAVQEVDLQQLIRALEMRVDPSGIMGVSIRPYGANEVEITIPQIGGDNPEAGSQELERVKFRVTSAGQLQFRILANNRDHPDLVARGLALPADQTEVINPETKKPEAWWVPVHADEQATIASYRDIAPPRHTADGKGLEVLVVDDPFDVTGDMLVRAARGTAEGGWSVDFVFNSAGAYRFGGLTGNNLPDETQQFYRHLGIILDGVLRSAPVIKSAITKHGQITGRFTREEADDLAAILDAGALPAQLNKTPLSEQHIGPLLGRDTIMRGSWAIGLSLAAVLVFMIFYYRFAGLIATMAVLTNLLMLLAIMIAVNAEFSLPGIAGLVLTVGMAVDANVLIYERIREERDRGAALRMAIRNGFSRALSAIVDANLTTLMIGIILYVIPEASQVRGFAVVLILGVVLSMYTAIFCGRVLFDIAEKQHWITELRMVRLFSAPHFNILSKRRLALAISALLIVIGLAAVVARGRGLLDIDFTGGVSVEVLFKKPVSIAEVRRRLAELPDLAVAGLRYGDEAPGVRFRINTSKSEYSPEEAQAAIAAVVSQQLDQLVPGQSAAERKALIDQLSRLLAVLIAEPSDSEAYATAWGRFHELLDQSLSGVTDRQRRQEAVAAVDARLHEVLLTPTELVEELIAQAFPGQLASNTLQIVNLAPIAAAEAEKAPAGEVSLRGSAGAAAPGLMGSPGFGPPLVQLALGQTAAEEARAAPTGQPGSQTSDGSGFGPAEEGAHPGEQAVVEAAEPGAAEQGEPLDAEPGKESPAEPAGPTEAAATEPGASAQPASETTAPRGPSAPPSQPSAASRSSPAPSEEEPSEPGAGKAAEPGPAPEPAAAPSPAPELLPAPEQAPSLPEQPPAVPAQPAPGPGAADQPPAEADPFAGGTHVTVNFSQPVSHDELRELLIAQLGAEAALRITNEEYRAGDKAGYDTWEISLTVPPERARQALEAIQARVENEPYFPSSTTIGSRVAGALQEKGLVAMLASLVGIVAYLWIRFQRVIYGLAAVVALIHDVLITLGLLALSAYLALIPGVSQLLLIDPFKIGLTVLAAFLTIIGYSLNDTIVVFDRIREVKGKAPRLTEEMINHSINQTLSRTLLTSLTTLLVVLILYAGGGQPVHTFAFALLVGIVVGTYSSIYIASPLLLWMSQPPKEAQ